MVRIRAGEITLGYEVSGPDGGERVVMLNGLGGPKEGWRFQVPTLSEHFHVLTIDNRGVGESDKPDHPYSIQMFAHDAANVMVALGWGDAHVVGASMGGMIAQEFALAFPHMTKSVSILCSTPGGSSAVPPSPEVLQLWSKRDSMPSEEFERQSAELGYSRSFREKNPELLEELIAESQAMRPAEYIFRRHLEAAMKHDASTRLKWIDAPVLVVHGTDDALLPHPNGEAIARSVRNAHLELFEGAGHALGVERQDELNALLSKWIDENS
jgi:3-oxoadipate enol-lactonase